MPEIKTTRQRGRKKIPDEFKEARSVLLEQENQKVDNAKQEAKKELARRELARRHLLPFVKYRFQSYKENWHHRVLADALERVENGSLKRLIVNMPPRHGKSELVSVNFPAWCMGRDSNRSIMAASYGAGLAQDFGRKVRNIMDDVEYKTLFDTRLAEDSQAKGKWATNGRGEYNAVGVGGSLTGLGAGILIIDDPVKNREEADSEVTSESIWDWYRSTARTRLTPDGAVVIVMTRWRDNDLVGRILEENRLSAGEQWEVVTLPAIAENDEEFRKEGEALWGDHYTLENLEQVRADVGNYEFASQYQQNPVNRETQVFKPELFRYIGLEEVRNMVTNCFITIDSALSKKKNSDSTGVTINWVNGDNVWHLKAYKVKVDPTELIQLIFDLHRIYKPEAIGLEETTMTQAIEPFLNVEMAKKNIYPNVVPLKHGGTAKETRIRGLLPRYDRGHIFHITGLCSDLEKELVRFPSSAHDDCMDSCFVSDTQILTDIGYKNISDIKSGDMVMTRQGYKEVLNSWCSGEKEVITNLGLTGTRKHPIILEGGSTKYLTNVSECDILYTWNNKTQQIEIQSYIKAKDIIETQIQKGDNIVSTTGDIAVIKNPLLRYIDKFGLMNMVKFLKDFISTILTEILSITRYRILDVFQRQTTQDTTAHSQTESESLKRALSLQTLLLESGTVQKKGLSGTENTQIEAYLGKNKLEFVQNVLRNIKLKLNNPRSIVPINVIQGQTQESLGGKTQVTIKKVYNLEVKDANEYFANNILVHNCAYQVFLAEAPNESFDWDEFEAQEMSGSELIYSDIGL